MGLSSQLAQWTDWRRKSPFRGILISVLAIALALKLSHFPSDHASLWLVLPALVVVGAILDTARCMHGRWDWYHGGVLLILYTELMTLALVLFFLIYPYWVM